MEISSSKNNFSYADAIKSKPNINNTSSPFKGNTNRNFNNSSNTVDAIHSLIARIDDIDNKLVFLSDEIISIKNKVLQQHHNQDDIDYHLSRLKIFTQIPDDENEELLMDIGDEQIQHIPKNTLTNNKQPLIADKPKDTVEHKLRNLRSELKSISLALRQALPMTNSSQ
ncbi:12909_t:CDS:2 [Funneliformis mosseae]|uniref:12909_t:CDS:1 n=1 Tax=Funneliformis mosseae TaxID=27381 RepID=A0A9N9B8A7_FUNMO|nr:12909_t:CDS:2 [Funneliformis mosseae]